MNEALRGFDYGENLDALLSAIRRNNPCAGTLMVNPDRISLLRFLQEKTQGFRPLVRSTDDYRDEGIYPYTGWYEVFWEGARIEIAFTPNYRNRETVCIGDDSGTLVRFAAALTEYTLRPRGRCLRYADGWENAAELDAEIEKVTWDDIVLAPGLMTGVRAAVESFFHQRDAFAAMGFAWRRGILLIGPPGTGKTMVCKAAAAALPELPFLYVRDLREEDHQEAIKAIFKRARRLAPCLLAFEDMDGLVTSENRTVFLNEMDGFQSNDGLLVIASSNHPGKIDEAMLKTAFAL